MKRDQVLRGHPDFARLWSGHAASTFGSNLSAVAVPLLVLNLTGSSVWVGVVSFVGMLALLLARLPAGALADRTNRRTTMIWCDLGRAVAVGSVAVAAYLHGLTLAHLIVVAVVVGVLSALFGPAAVSALPRVVPRAALTAAMTRNQLRDQTASLIGPPVGGALYTIARALPFAADAVSYLASALLIGGIRTDMSVPERDRTGMSRDIAAGFRWLFGRRRLVLVVLWSAVTNFTLNGVSVGVVVVAVRHGAAPFQVGLMQALGGLGGVLGALAAGKLVRLFSLRLALGLTGLAWMVLFSAMTINPNVYYLGALLMLAIAVAPTTAALVNTVLVVDTPDELRGRVSSTAGLIASSANPLGPLVMGLLLAVAPGPAMVVFGAVVGAGTLGYLLAGGRRAEPGESTTDEGMAADGRGADPAGSRS